MLYILQQYAITFGWALTGAVSMAIALGIMLKIFDWFTPINEWQEVKEKNIGVIILMSVVIFSTALVIAVAIIP